MTLTSGLEYHSQYTRTHWLALMAHAYNPSYSGGSNQKIEVQSQPGQIVLEIVLYLEIPNTKKGLAE
jgi:hypothetical protein